MHLLSSNGDEKNDVKMPDGEIGAKIQEYEDAGTDCCTFLHISLIRLILQDFTNIALVVTIIAAMGEEACIAVKEAPK